MAKEKIKTKAIIINKDDWDFLRERVFEFEKSYAEVVSDLVKEYKEITSTKNEK